MQTIDAVQALKDRWKDVYKVACVGHQDWIVNQMIAECKKIGEPKTAQFLTLATNGEVQKWINT